MLRSGIHKLLAILVIAFAGCIQPSESGGSATTAFDPLEESQIDPVPVGSGTPQDLPAPAPEPCASEERRIVKVEHAWPFPDDGYSEYEFETTANHTNITVSGVTNMTFVGFLQPNEGDDYFFINATAPNGTSYEVKRNNNVYFPDPTSSLPDQRAQSFSAAITDDAAPGVWRLTFEGRGNVRTSADIHLEPVSECPTTSTATSR